MTENVNKLYCYNHPTVETLLRCKRCDNPICVKCAVKTPTGYQCPDCVKKHQKIFDTATAIDYPMGFITALVLSGLASFLVSLVGGFGFFAWFAILFGAPSAGAIIAEGCRRVTQRHRSKELFQVILAGAVIGALPMIGFNVIFGFNLFGVLFQAAYLVLAIPALYTRLSGIQLFR